jgi:hypothetical protein
MRTTVTLEPDVDARLRQRARERNISFKEALNEALRAGLASSQAPRPFRQKTYRLGLRSGVDLTKAAQLAAQLEDEETLRKLELRK